MAYVRTRHRVAAGIPRDHPESYHSFMWNHLFKHIDIDPKNAHILDGNAPDLQVECDKFEKLMSDAGGVELFIGGLFEKLMSDAGGVELFIGGLFALLSLLTTFCCLHISRYSPHYDGPSLWWTGIILDCTASVYNRMTAN